MVLFNYTLCLNVLCVASVSYPVTMTFVCINICLTSCFFASILLNKLFQIDFLEGKLMQAHATVKRCPSLVWPHEGAKIPKLP